jgi:hypothetical protein
MDNIAGSPVEGDNFHGREADVVRLRETLDNHDVLLLGPRRIGKTSIARAIIAKVRTEGWRAREVNVAACQDEREFLYKLDAALRPELATLPGKVKEAIVSTWDATTQRIKSIKLSIAGTAALDVGIASSAPEDWTLVANDLLRLISQANQRWLIYVDELPILLFNIIRTDPHNGVQRVRRFLDWFRNDVRAIPEVSNIRWLVSGSVGLDTLVQQHGMADTINSMKHEGLEAFSEPVAVAMLDKLAQRYAITLAEGDAQKIIASVLWPQPYYLQAAFHHLRVLMGQTPTAQATLLIDQAIEKMVQPGGDNDFHHWEKRLTIQLPSADAAHCLALLNLAATDPQGIRAENLLAALQERLPQTTTEEAKQVFINLRDILQRDAYWWPDDSAGHRRYRFRLEPLRRWWLRRNTL